MQIMEKVRQSKLIVIVRNLAPENMLKLAEALRTGGIDMMEVTFNQAQPDRWHETTDAIGLLRRTFGEDLYVGAGTVVTPEQVWMACDAGAQYIISPNVDAEVIQATKSLGLTSMPGAFTPTEAMAAFKAGCDAVKIFPAGNLGPEYLRAIKAPLSHIPFLAVGGVSERNARDFLRAGAVGLGVGGNLVNKEWIADGAFDKITELARAYVTAVREA